MVDLIELDLLKVYLFAKFSSLAFIIIEQMQGMSSRFGLQSKAAFRLCSLL